MSFRFGPTRRTGAPIALFVGLLLSFSIGGRVHGAEAPAPQQSGTGLSVSKSERIGYIREAEVWSPIDTASLDIMAGPPGGVPLPADGVLVCRFHVPAEKPGGRSQKFFCQTDDGKVHKIKYGIENKEIYGELIGTRMLWALGFKADLVQPVRVRCIGCPEDPWGYLESLRDWAEPTPVPDPAERMIEPATLETYHAQLIEAKKDQGVKWKEILELRSRDPEKAEQQRIHREALTLFASYMMHADSKAGNQSLACAWGGVATAPDGRRICERPILYIGDLGGIGGYGWVPFREASAKRLVSPSKVGWGDWVEFSVWKDPEECIARVNSLPNATLRNERISEEGRRFLAERLSLITRDQWLALIRVTRAELLGHEIETPDGGRRPVTPEDRYEAMQPKLREITDHRCPPGSDG